VQRAVKTVTVSGVARIVPLVATLVLLSVVVNSLVPPGRVALDLPVPAVSTLDAGPSTHTASAVCTASKVTTCNVTVATDSGSAILIFMLGAVSSTANVSASGTGSAVGRTLFQEVSAFDPNSNNLRAVLFFAYEVAAGFATIYVNLSVASLYRVIVVDVDGTTDAATTVDGTGVSYSQLSINQTTTPTVSFHASSSADETYAAFLGRATSSYTVSGSANSIYAVLGGSDSSYEIWATNTSSTGANTMSETATTPLYYVGVGVALKTPLAATLRANPLTPQVGESTTISYRIVGGVPPYTWTLEEEGSSSNLSGVAGSSSGHYTFIPTDAATYTFFLRVADADLQTSNVSVSVTVVLVTIATPTTLLGLPAIEAYLLLGDIGALVLAGVVHELRVRARGSAVRQVPWNRS
jgi:hypothetical protein